MLLLVNFVFASFLFGIGYSKTEYDVVIAHYRDEYFDVDKVYRRNRETMENEFEHPFNEDLVYYTNPGPGQVQIDFCLNLKVETHECIRAQILWTKVRFNHFLRSYDDIGKWLLIFDILVIDPIKIPSHTSFFYVDVFTFNFPAFSMYYPNEEYMRVMFLLDHHDAMYDQKYSHYVILEDPQDRCREYRPKVVDGNNLLNINLFLNRKWTHYAYFFIKKDQYVCGYTFEYTDLFKGNKTNEERISPVGFNLIDNYPTENYAPNFFCIDPLYGTFVSLYWNQHQPGSLPEAHYYIINENDLTNIQLIDRLVLKDFDEDVLKDIFDNNFDSKHYPGFTSYGRTIFIWFKRPSESRAFNGFWKDESDYEVHFENVASSTQRKLFRAKREYIQVDRPVGRKEVTATPQPITLFPTTQPPQTTSPPPTTQLLTTISESLPSTLSATSEQTTEQSTTTLTATSTSTESSVSSTSESNYRNAAAQTSNSDDCQYETYLWILIALICVDALLGIILGILIAIKFRGAKKMKEAMKKRYAKPGSAVSSKKKKPSKPKMQKENKSKANKKSKKSTKETSVTTKTEDAASGNKTTEAKKETTTTTVDQTTNYYTVNEKFDKK